MIQQDRVIQLLGSGLSAEVVATAVGCEPSYISQLLADDEFAKKVSELRIQNLQAATKRDNKWDEIEDKLLDKLKDSVEYIMKPREILAALATVNSAKRRGATAQESLTINNTVVNLTLPQKAVHNFVVNQTNQVIGVNDQSLLTMPSMNVKSLLQQAKSLADTQNLANLENKDGPQDDRNVKAESPAARLRARLAKPATRASADDL
jgi:hypothetical protein